MGLKLQLKYFIVIGKPHPKSLPRTIANFARTLAQGAKG